MAAPMQLGIQISVTGGKQGAAEISQTTQAALDLGEGARDAATGLGQLTQTEQRGVSATSDLARTWTQSTGVAHTLGQSALDAASGLGQLTQTEINASQASLRMATGWQQAYQSGLALRSGVQQTGQAVQQLEVKDAAAAQATHALTQATQALTQVMQAQAQQSKTTGDALHHQGDEASGLTSRFGDLKSMLLGYLTVQSAMGAASWILHQTSELQQLQDRLHSVTTSLDEYQQVQGGVFAMANRWGAAVGETANAFARLNPTVRAMGLTSKDTLYMLDGLSASLRLSGATTAETSAVMLQFSQAMGSGRVGGDEFRSMMESAQPMMRAVAEQLHTTTGGLRLMAEEGKLTSSVFANAMMPAVAGMVAQAQKIAPTLDQTAQALKNNALKDFGREFEAQGQIAGQAVKWLADHTLELAAAAHAAVDAVTEVGEKAAVAAGVGAVGALLLTMGGAAKNAVGLAEGLASVNRVNAALVTSAAMQKLETLSTAGKAGLLTAVFFGAYEIGSWLGEMETVRGAVGRLLEPVFRAYDLTTGDQRRKAQIAVDDAKAKLKELQDAKSSGQKAAWQDTTVLGTASKKLVPIDELIAQASADTQKLDAAYQGFFAAPAKAAAQAAPINRASAAGEYEALTKDLKYREKIIVEYNTKLLNLQQSFADKSADIKDNPKALADLQHRQQQELSALMRERKAALEGAGDYKDGQEAAKKNLDATLAIEEQKQTGIQAALKREEEALQSRYEVAQSAYAAMQAAQRGDLTAQQTYYAARRDLALTANADMQASVQAELDTVKKSGLAEKEKLPAIQKYREELKKLSEDAKNITAQFDADVVKGEAKAQAKINETMQQWAQQSYEARQHVSQAIAEYAASIAAQNEQTRLELSLAGATSQERELALAQYKIELDLKKKIKEINATPGMGDDFEKLKAQQIAVAQAAADQARAGAAAQVELGRVQSLMGTLDSTGREVFASLFESGHSAFKSLGQSLKKELIDMLYQMTVRRWVLNIGANVVSSVTGSAASAAANSAVGAATGGTGNALGSLAGNVAGSAGSSAITSWLSSSFPQASAVLTNFGNGAIASAQSAVGITGTQAQMASSLSSAGAYGGDAAATSLGSSLGAYVPYVAAALVIASQWKNIFGGKVSNNGSGIQGDFSSSGFAGVNYSDMHKSGGWFKSSKDWTDTSALDITLQSALGTAYQGILTQTDSYATALGLQTTALDSYVGHIRVSTKGLSAEQATQALQAQLKAQQEALSALALGTESYNKLGESSADALTRLSSSLSTVNNWLKLLDDQALQTSLDGADAASKLADLTGGVSSFASAAQQFYDAYTSDAEKVEKSQAQMREQLAAVGVALPSSKEAFKAVADGLDLTTDAGRKAYAVMLAVAPQFANTQNKLAELANTTTKDLIAQLTGRSGVAPALGTTALSSQALHAHLLALQDGADATRIDIDALSASLSGVSTAEYVSALSTIFESLSSRLQSVVESINTERTALTQSVLQIINPTVMSKSQIQTGISSVNTALPSNAGVLQSNSLLAFLDDVKSEAAWRKFAGETFSEAQQSAIQNFQGQAEYRGVSTQAQPLIDAMTFDDGLWFNPFGGGGYLHTATLSNYDAVSAPAAAAAAQAILDYGAALQSFTIDAGKSVNKLTQLREETVKYYEAQAKLADLLNTSAANIRKTISDYRLSQMSADDQYGQLAYKFASTYSMVLSTTGETAAGYVDKLNAQLSDLIAATKSVDGSTVLGGASASDMIASYLAQANVAAVKMDSGVAALGDYQADSLGLLGNIDATLAALDVSTKSAEAIIADAVKAGSDRTASGLQQVINAITGQSVQAFANGGAFVNGVVTKPTFFNPAVMGEDPRSDGEGILPLKTVNGRLGVHASFSGRSSRTNDAALLAELVALRAEVAALRGATERTADNTQATASNTLTHQRQHARWVVEQQLLQEEA